MIDDWGLENIRIKEKTEMIHEKAAAKIKKAKEGGFNFVGPGLDVVPNR